MQPAESDDTALQKETVQTLIALVHRHEANQSAAADADALTLLLQLARSDDAALQQAAVQTLGAVVDRHEANQSAAADAGALTLLLQLARSDDAALQQAAVQTLGAVVDRHEANQSAAADAGALTLLLQLARSDDAALQCAAVSVFSILVTGHDTNLVLAGTICSVEIMCKLLSVPAVAWCALLALADLTRVASNASEAVGFGAVEILLQLRDNFSEDFRAASTAVIGIIQTAMLPPWRTKQFVALFADKVLSDRDPHFWFGSIGNSANVLAELANQCISDSVSPKFLFERDQWKDLEKVTQLFRDHCVFGSRSDFERSMQDSKWQFLLFNGGWAMPRCIGHEIVYIIERSK